jgi:AcrR family transcriptional regulator
MSHSRKQDPRSAATKEKIINAYIQLLSETKPEYISALEICEIANIHRSTFYRHYESINDIEIDIEKMVLKTFSDILDNTPLDDFINGRKIFLKTVSETIRNDLSFYTKVLLVNRRVDFIEKIDATIRNKLKETLSEKTELSDDEIDYVFTFAVAGRVAVYRKWIMSGFKQSEETISSILEKVSSKGFDSFLQ